MRIRVAVLLVVLALAAAACSSGPSSDDLRLPTTTTTTEAPDEDVLLVRITNGTFQPPTLTIDLTAVTLVQFEHDDDPERMYVLSSDDDLFEPVDLEAGDVFEFDFADAEPDIYRFKALLGFQRIPLSIDTRPAQ